MYNLANIHIFEKPFENSIDLAIELLVKSLNKGFVFSESLLCIALIKKYGRDVNSDNINDELNKFIDNANCLLPSINQTIESINFEEALDFYSKTDFLYNYKYQGIFSSSIIQRFTFLYLLIKKDISKDFYEGFGLDDQK